MKGLVFLILMLTFFLLSVGPVFATGEKEDVTEEVSVEPISIMHDKGGTVGWTSRLKEMAELYFAETGGRTFDPVEFTNTDVFKTSLRAALASKDPPGMFTWWAGYNMDEFAAAGLAADVSFLWDKHKSEYSPGLRKAYSVGGRTYAIPAGIAYWVMFYNVKLFAQYDLDPPETWDQLMVICETLKSNDIIPMAGSVQGWWPPMIQFMEFLVRIDPDFYEKLMDGKANYTDPEVGQAFDVWGDLIDKGYLSDPSTDLFSEFPRLMADGKAAMIDMGTWYTSVLDAAGLEMGTDYDFFLIPSINPDAGKVVIYEATPILIAEKGDGKATALKIADWWMSASAQEKWGSLIGQLPSNMDSNIDFLPVPLQTLVSKMNSDNYRLVNRFFEATPPDIANEAINQFGAFVVNPEKKMDVMKDLEKISSSYWE